MNAASKYPGYRYNLHQNIGVATVRHGLNTPSNTLLIWPGTTVTCCWYPAVRSITDEIDTPPKRTAGTGTPYRTYPLQHYTCRVSSNRPCVMIRSLGQVRLNTIDSEYAWTRTLQVESRYICLPTNWYVYIATTTTTAVGRVALPEPAR